MDFYQTVRAEYLRCQALLQTLKRYAKTPLTGHVSVRRNRNGTVRYYRVFRDWKTGCRKTERIEDLAMVNDLNRKNLCLRWQRTAEKNMELLEPVLSHFTRIDPSILAAVVPGQLEIPDRSYPQKNKDPFRWEDLRPSAGTFRPEGLAFEADGRKFRSKGEVAHALCFQKYDLEYIYEPEVRIGGIVLHPDFAVRNKRTGRIYFWEYFGMLDVKEYRDAFCRKLPALMELGIIPGYNLICTCEFKGICELNISDIEAKIKAYLL